MLIKNSGSEKLTDLQRSCWKPHFAHSNFNNKRKKRLSWWGSQWIQTLSWKHHVCVFGRKPENPTGNPHRHQSGNHFFCFLRWIKATRNVASVINVTLQELNDFCGLNAVNLWQSASLNLRLMICSRSPGFSKQRSCRRSLITFKEILDKMPFEKS